MVALAPDPNTLAAIAAGPVESLLASHREQFLPLFHAEAERSERFRLCLQSAYVDVPAELEELIERDTPSATMLPRANADAIDAEATALIVAWFQHANTGWAPSLLDALIAEDPAAAWDAIRVLLVFANDDPALREEVGEQAVTRFVKKRGDEFRETLLVAAERHPWARQWLATAPPPSSASAPPTE